jgi:endonuclease III
MRKSERFQHLIDHFTTHFPEPETELHYTNAYELIVAVVLSAQCTDKRVNMVTPALLEQFPTPGHLAAASPEDVLPFIKSISYPNNKAKHLAGLGKMLVSQFNGEVPSTVEDLVKLPGVGRKTANVIASVIYNQPAMAVDTHVFRVSKRIGLASAKAHTPREVENQLMKYIPLALVPKAHHWLILHGRYICVARRPKCEECPLTFFCQFYQKHYPNLPDDPENKI